MKEGRIVLMMVTVVFLFSGIALGQNLCPAKIINSLNSTISLRIDWHKETVLAPGEEIDFYFRPGGHIVLVKELYPAGYSTKKSRKWLKQHFYIDQNRKNFIWDISKKDFIPVY